MEGASGIVPHHTPTAGTGFFKRPVAVPDESPPTHSKRMCRPENDLDDSERCGRTTHGMPGISDDDQDMEGEIVPHHTPTAGTSTTSGECEMLSTDSASGWATRGVQQLSDWIASRGLTLSPDMKRLVERVVTQLGSHHDRSRASVDTLSDTLISLYDDLTAASVAIMRELMGSGFFSHQEVLEQDDMDLRTAALSGIIFVGAYGSPLNRGHSYRNLTMRNMNAYVPSWRDLHSNEDNENEGGLICDT